MQSVDEHLEENQSPSSIRAVTRIRIDKLFGIFDYDLRSSAQNRDLTRLFILYGENGSGKTRLLQVVYHLLSPAQDRGHRRRVADLVFQTLMVDLSDGTQLVVRRETPTSGDFFLSCKSPLLLEELAGVYSLAKRDFETDELSNSFKHFVQKLDLQLYMLSADRSFTSDLLPRESREVLLARERYGRMPRRFEEEEQEEQRSSLKDAMRTVTELLRRRSVRATATGGLNVNSIYTEVIRNIATLGLQQDSELADLDALRRRLSSLSERAKVFANYKMLAPLRTEALERLLGEINEENSSLASNVLSPYLDSIEAQLDALQSTQQLISTLLKTVNSFLVGKKLRFTIPEGLHIKSRGSTLAASSLSSGEQHLLLIFCYTVIARNKQTIFLIDEPEISLNVKWQAKFLPRIMELAGDAPMQFILATHSIELLSEYIENVVRLPPYRDEQDAD